MLRGLFLTIVSIIWSFILILVGARFLALLAGANPYNELVRFIYRRSDFWVKPFFTIDGLANRTLERSGRVFEPASLVALAVYFVAGSLILTLLRAVFYNNSNR